VRPSASEEYSDRIAAQLAEEDAAKRRRKVGIMFYTYAMSTALTD